MKRFLYIFILVVGFALHQTAGSLFPELAADHIEAPLKNLLKEKYETVLLACYGAYAIAAAAALVYAFLDKRENNKAAENIDRPVEEDLFERAREGQRKAYEDRSNRKLAGRDFIDLEVSYTVEGSHDLAPLLNKGVEEGEKEQDLFKVFEGASGRLLVIGLPGSGKTTLLLQLAIALLDKYEEKIPVVLDIATWQPRFKTIEEWAVELLPDMGFNKNLAQQLIDEKKLLPLFDGLDELREGSRPGFLAAVEKYSADKGSKFVITSRKAEYAATIDAAVEYQVVVNPFTLFQIKEALHKKPSQESPAMLIQIDKDEHFAKAIKTPFYLNAVQLLFSHKILSQKLVFKTDDLEGRKGEIETAFVEFGLEGLDNYSKEDGRKWLAFLADRMSRRGLVRFELADIQYDWGKFELWTIWLSRLLFGIVATTFYNLIYFLTLSLVFVFTDGSIGVFFLIYLLGVFLFLAILTFMVGDNALIRVKGRIKWSFNIFMIHVIDNMSFNILFGVVYGLIFGPLHGLFFGLLYALLFSLNGIIANNYNAYLKVRKPYERFYGSMWSLYFSILQHWHLCYLLRKKGLLPRKYPDFLKAATEQNILESDGGSWRFRHRILQEYFVGVWEEEYGGDEALKDGYEASSK